MTAERMFQILAVILAGFAAFFLWRGDTDWLFASAVLGAVSFFLSIRFQIKDRLRQREAEMHTTDEHDESPHEEHPDESSTDESLRY